MPLNGFIVSLSRVLENPQHLFSFLFSLGFFFCLTLFLHGAIVFVCNRLLKKNSLKLHPWPNQLFRVLKAPLLILIWILFLSFVADKIFLFINFLEVPNLLVIQKIRELTLLAFFLWIAFAYINRMEAVYKKEIQITHNDPTLIHAVAQLSRLAVAFIGFLVLLSHLGVSVASLATIGGVGTAGIALAAQKMLANFFSGLMLYMNRPFVVGDKISSPDRAIEGIVEEMGWTVTRLRDNDKQPIFVPNSLFSDIILVNVTRKTHFRILTDIGLRYEDADKVEAIVADIRALVSTHPKVDPLQNNVISFNKMLDSSLNINLSIYTAATTGVEFAAIQQDILLGVMAIITHHKAECAFPSRSLYMVGAASSAPSPALEI
jgi:MscS family membrane protein